MASLRNRILCTENDADTRDLIKFVLSGEGYDVVTVESAQQAFRLAQSGSFDLYLIDNWMPGLSGDELTRRIREHDSETPILFYSGAAQEADKESARASGAQGYLVKPAGVDELIDEVARLIAEAKIAHPVKVITARNFR